MTSALQFEPKKDVRNDRRIPRPEKTSRRAKGQESRGSHFATLLSARLRPVLRNGKTLYEVPIAVTGSWVKQGRRFQITSEDLADMVLNFSKRKNEQIVIDYEHASETPEVAQGGPIPAAGWIHHLQSGSWGPGVGSCKDSAPESRVPSPESRLYALVEWTPEAERLIQQGAYRFFSPAIDWSYRDKQTGEPQGATLTSGALTNHPFLEELPPIMLTDLDTEERGWGLGVPVSQKQSGDVRIVSANAESLIPNPETQGGSKVKKLVLTKLTEGPLAGQYGVFDEATPVGYVNADEFRDYVDDLFKQSESSESTGTASRLFAERVGMPGASAEAIKERVALAARLEAESVVSARSLRLFETFKDGAVNQTRAMELARDDKITLADYIAVQDAEKKLDEAVREGKILPRDRQFFFRDALERPSEFADFVKSAVPVVRLGSQGIGSVRDIGVDEEVEIRTRNLMKDEGLSYSKALKRVLAGDKDLERRYHGTHRREIGSTTASAVDGSDAVGITQ